MMKTTYTPLHKRSVIKITGEDARSFLQGLITNDINKLDSIKAIYACMLTPQGKYLFDFFVYNNNDELWLDCSAAQKDSLLKRLNMYKLRSQVELHDLADEYEVIALLNPLSSGEEIGGISFTDPRTAELGTRLIVKTGDYSSIGSVQKATQDDYNKLRISLCVPDSDTDLIPEKSFPLQHRMEEMHAIDYDKGCYVGQEVTARTKHKGTIRKTLFTIKSAATLPAAGTEITSKDKKIGEMRSSVGNIGIALLDIDAAESGAEMLAGNVSLQMST